MRDISKMFASLSVEGTAVKDRLKFEHITFTYEDERKRTQIAYRLNPEAVLLLVTGYSVRLRAAVILRLKELEETIATTHLSLHKQILALEAQDKTTFQFASWGSKKMNERKKSIKAIRSERERLFKEAQVQLFDAE